MRSKDYGSDVLSQPSRRTAPPPTVAVETGMVLEDRDSGFCGAVVELDRAAMTLEDRSGRRRVFPFTHRGFLVEGRPVRVARPLATSPVRSTRTASGSTRVEGRPAQVARPSRLLVEGLHDCELVERIWGDDLRVEGVVVEQLEGADHLPDVVREFRPHAGARLGVLLDHLVPGSKESRIAQQVRGEHVLVVGHPFVDIWQAVRPARVGLPSWPHVPPGQPWKERMAAALGEPDVASAWRRIRAAVRDFRDLEPELLGPVEALIDFVTATGGASSEG